MREMSYKKGKGIVYSPIVKDQSADIDSARSAVANTLHANAVLIEDCCANMRKKVGFVVQTKLKMPWALVVRQLKTEQTSP